MLSLFIHFLLVIEILVSLLIILVVLMQRPKSEGLGAAFGGGMTEQFFGAQTTNVLAAVTRWLGGIFFLLTLTLSILYSRQSTASSPATLHLLQSTAPLPRGARATGTTGTDTDQEIPPASTGAAVPAASAAPESTLPASSPSAGSPNTPAPAAPAVSAAPQPAASPTP